MSKGKAFADSLREIADFYDAHPDFPVPHMSNQFNIFADNKEEMMKHAKQLGNVKKVKHGTYFILRRVFGNIEFDVNGTHQAVCERVVVGTRKVIKKTPIEFKEEEVEEEIVEWKCPDSLMKEQA